MAESNQVVLTLDIVGAVASVAGLLLGIWVLVVARGARQAAKEARSLARRRDLVEELQDVSQKLQQVGTFLQQQEWLGVQIRTTEILVNCRSAMARWSDQLSIQRRNVVL